MAFDAATGATRWAAHDFEAAYASPIIIQFGGRDHLITFTGGEVSGMNPETGELLWSYPHKTQYGANISTPVWTGDGLLFLSAAYGSGSRVIRLKQDGDKTVAEEVWANRKMSIHFGDAVRVGDHVYGSSGDFGPAFLMCVNVNDGEVAWKERGFKKANVLFADGKLIVLDEDGVLALVKCAPTACEILSQSQLVQRVAWTVPALADNTLYIRDRKTIMAVDLGP
jgi:prepilin-type processing-associated H-X9-DG protein